MSDYPFPPGPLSAAALNRAIAATRDIATANAADAAGAAKGAAAARDAAETHRDLARTARSGAEDAQSRAQGALVGAGVARAGAEAARDTSVAKAAAASGSEAAAAASAESALRVAAGIGDLSQALGRADAAATAAAADRFVTGQDRVQTGADRTVTQAAATSSQQSADLSRAGANLYPTTAAGVAAVVEGTTFNVVGDTAATYAITYRKVSGAAVEVARYPSKVALDTKTADLDETALDPANTGPSGIIPLIHAVSAEDVTRALVLLGWDTVNGRLVVGPLYAPSLTAPNLPTGEKTTFLFAATAAALQAMTAGRAEGSFGAVESGVDKGLYRLTSGTYVRFSTRSLTETVQASADLLEVQNDTAPVLGGIVPLLLAESAEDSTRGVPVIWFDKADGRIHIASAYLHDVQAPTLALGKATPNDAFAASRLVNPGTGAVVSPILNDNDGRRYFQRLWDSTAIYVFLWLGQSLNGGQASLLHSPYAPGAPQADADKQAALVARTYAPLTTAAQNPAPTKLLMPNSGSNIVGQAWSSLVPLEEYYKVPAGTQTPSGESPVSQAVFTLWSRLKADFPTLTDAQLPTIVAANAAVGSSSILNLGPGRASFQSVIAFLNWLQSYAKAQGKRVVVLTGQYRGFEADWDIGRPYDIWNEDSADPSIVKGREKETLMQAMSRYRRDLETVVKSITGQSEPLTLFWDQVQVGASSYTNAAHNPRATMAQLDIGRLDPLCVPMGSKAAGPANILDFIHPSPHGYAWQGQWDGAIMYRHLFSVEGWVPLRAIEFYRTGTLTYDLRFSRHCTLLTDDSIVDVTALGAGKGISILDGGASLVGIAGIAQQAPDTLRVTLSAAPTGFRTLRAHIGLSSFGNRRGNRTGARTAIVGGSGATVTSLFGAAHQPPVFAGEVNDEGTAWPSYPNPLPGLDMASHQQIKLEDQY